MKDNLPLELLTRHRDELNALGLDDALMIESDVDLFQTLSAPAASAVVFLPKSKPLIYMTLALVSNMVAPDGLIVLGGTNDAGIRSAKDAFEKYIGPVDQKIVGNHSALYVGKNKKAPGGKTWQDFLSFFRLEYGDVTIEAAKLPGVFSAGELDEGTKLLLDNIPYDRTSVLDVGCGAGLIGAIYKKKNPAAQVTMSDSSPFAIKATEQTLAKNKIKADVILSNVFEKIPGHFDLIVTNPPFHKGIGTDYSFIETFARDAKSMLNKGGAVYLVANSFLAYQPTLERYIGPTEIVIENPKFRVFKSVAR